MNQNKESPCKPQEGLFTAISAGFFLLLVGAIFVITPNLLDAIMDFFGDISIVNVPNTDAMFLGPELPLSHITVYQAVGQFSIAWSILQVVMLALRFIVHSSWQKRSETVGNLVYWTGAAVLIQTFLIENTQWFAFWSIILIIIGVSLIARAAVMAISRI
ncbi:MAG: hypothetical protein CW691_01385 [Candidatus Bathyarchaeum sp.]|nr:MAG: hypothetical protein CW691_01385 [Candidatus Bathyarchaeum sp.]